MWTYGVLFTFALIDVVLYLVVGNVLHCYRCQAQYRGVPGLEEHQPFNLETHEKHRQQQIRLKSETRSTKHETNSKASIAGNNKTNSLA
jgi:hypothetical protein